MDKAKQVADELKKMYLTNQIPTSVQEDINEISDGLTNGTVDLNDLENRDPFVVDVIHKALNRVGGQ